MEVHLIYYKLDWFQGRCFNRSVQSVVSLFGYEDAFDQFLAGDLIPRERMTGYGSHYVFAIDDFRIVIPKDVFEMHLALDGQWDWFTSPISAFGLEISGSGLDQLRANGLDVDSVLTDPEFLGVPDYFKPTRADFAFDYVNCCEGFMKEALCFCESAMISGYKRLLNGSNGGISYSVHHSPAEETIYFGTTRSDHLVRCYNKKLQLDPLGVDPSVYPSSFSAEGEVKSWFRIELQARRQVAVDCLYQPLQFKKLVQDTAFFDEASPLAYVLCYIRQNFLIQDFETKKVLPCFAQLFMWEKLPVLRRFEILYNSEKGRTVDRLNNWLARNSRSVALYIATYGLQSLFNEVQRYLFEWQQSGSVTGLRRYNSFVSDLAALCSETGMKRSDFHLDFDSGSISLRQEVKPI